MSNFQFLQKEWPSLFIAAHKAEGLVHSDPRASCFYARYALEQAVHWLYKHDKGLHLPYQDNLSALIHEPSFKHSVGNALFTKAKLIKELGNLAVHSNKSIAFTDSLSASRELFHFCFWLARTYTQSVPPAPNLSFSAALIPKGLPIPSQTLAQLQQLEKDLQAKDERLSALLADKTALSEELKNLREEVAAAKQANAALPDTHDYSEAETRKAFIDLLLKEAGWALDPARNFEVEVTGMPTSTSLSHRASASLSHRASASLSHRASASLSHRASTPLSHRSLSGAEGSGTEPGLALSGAEQGLALSGAEGKGYVDYVLWGDDSKPLALIEAKRTTKDPNIGQQQAKLYADCLEKQYGQRPIIFYSNGYEHWLWDDASYPPREVQGFYKQAELELLIQRRSSRKPQAAGRHRHQRQDH